MDGCFGAQAAIRVRGGIFCTGGRRIVRAEENGAEEATDGEGGSSISPTFVGEGEGPVALASEAEKRPNICVLPSGPIA